MYNPPQITVNSHPLNSLEKFTYLGNIISNDASNTKDVGHRLTKASSSFGHLQHRVWQNHSFHLMTKVRVYVAVVISTLLYAAETWVLYRKHIKLLEHFRQPEVLALHHGNTLAGLRHQRRGSRMGWTAKYRGYAAHRHLHWVRHVLRINDIRMPKSVSTRTSWSDSLHRLVLITNTGRCLHQTGSNEGQPPNAQNSSSRTSGWSLLRRN